MIDTLAKRLSVMAFGVAGLTLPAPDGAITSGDRQTLLGIPSSVAVSETFPAAAVGVTRQVICHSRATFSNSATRWFDIVGGGALAESSDDGASTIWACTGVWQNLVITLDVAPGSGKSWTFTVQVEGVDTAMVVTIADSAVTGQFTASDIAFTKYQRIRLKSVPSGAPSNFTAIQTRIEWVGETPNESGYAVDSGGINVATGFFPAFGGGSLHAFNATGPGNKIQPVAAAGSITGIAWRILTPYDPGEGYNIRVVKNTVLQDGAGATVDTTLAAIGNGSDQVFFCTFVLPVLPGDQVYLESERVGTPGGTTASVATTFLATTNGQSQFCGNPEDTTAGTTEYCSASGVNNEWVTTESAAQQDRGGVTPFTLKGFQIIQTVAAGGAASNTWKARKNGADAGPSITLAGASTTGSDTAPEFEITDGDTFGLQRTEASNPATTAVSWSFIQETEVDEPSGGGDIPPGVNPAPGDPVGTLHFAQIDIDGTSRFAAESIIRDPQAAWGGKKPATLKTIRISRRELSRDGYRPTSFSFSVADPQNLWRGFSATDTLEAAYVAIYRCSAPNGTIVGTPFRLIAGRIKPGGFTGVEGREFSFDCVDVLGEYFADARSQPTFPTKRFSLAEFAGMDPDFDGKVAAKALGRLVEDGVGVVPAPYLGEVNPSIDFDPAGENVLYLVLMISEGAVFSIPMTYINLLTWSASTVIAAGVYARPTPDSTAAGAGYYFKATVGGTTGGSEPTWPTTGTVGDGGVTWEVVGLDDGTTRIPIPESVYDAGVEFTHSRAANWTTVTGLADPYVDWIDGRRYTIALLKSSNYYAEAVKEGRIQPLFDVVGATTDAIGSGPPILDPGYLITYILLQYVFADNDGTTDIVIPTLPGLDGEPPYSVIDTDSADAAKAVCDAEMLGGYVMGHLAGASGEPDSVWDVIARFLRGGALEMGPNRHGQLMFSRRDLEAAAVIRFNPQRDFTSATYRVDERHRGTRIHYRYGYRYADPFAPLSAPAPGQPVRAIGGLPLYGEWASGLQMLVATAAETALSAAAGSPRRKLIELDNDMTRDATTANLVALRELDYGTGPSPSYHGTMLCEIEGPDDTLLMRLDVNGKTREIGDVFEIDDPQGMATTGYTAKRFRLLWIDHDPQRRLMKIGGEALDTSVVVVA